MLPWAVPILLYQEFQNGFYIGSLKLRPLEVFFLLEKYLLLEQQYWRGSLYALLSSICEYLLKSKFTRNMSLFIIWQFALQMPLICTTMLVWFSGLMTNRQFDFVSVKCQISSEVKCLKNEDVSLCLFNMGQTRSTYYRKRSHRTI